ncbi:MAG: hypothetical protein SGI92_30795 [Bryobacteraceae bacterium]|nr:hypothetical protein [Bryobacteraceae bacterium]
MKTAYIALLFLAGLLVMAATPAHAATQRQNITEYLLTNNTVMFNDGTSMVVRDVTPTKNTTKAVTTKYPLPHWMPQAFDGTAQTCKMGVIGKNSRSQPVCYRRRGRT